MNDDKNVQEHKKNVVVFAYGVNSELLLIVFHKSFCLVQPSARSVVCFSANQNITIWTVVQLSSTVNIASVI